MCDWYQVGDHHAGLHARKNCYCAWCGQAIHARDEITTVTFQNLGDDCSLETRRFHPECARAMPIFFAETGDCYQAPMMRGEPAFDDEAPL